ncbi:aspartyl/glutamyl-tRNA amidotransferase subunit A [Candidatus Giovannonibacteria bacterium RIFCSPHIGHO2_01_FULL_48_47]|nr:MAG: aspartyl/glutamyl-tRNA amidotransferase subunit A [Candidatus Giovannonibacteria bacterium RIFCSPHIGHO2_01_FULL_48_47]OGF68508.1 MAG: aspartyl/glutamyl-tRNA amidotransferase subunit A [Candidatus Giovannonibacteria bacterium RIFCSPHIGHO2_02_FULL_48_15]OGF88470.1 MAG: aspartyl/glutamyl-tRNA amidotransferase subunit A [Candidatus Giovannonibacteria bacterium RIFCSPLOWO2_01_FULL_48_47]OGF94908.1 MAG: aspartyl/glutamyl-tRNA amidotransferase subunit A [Candidatus Giovannonibacteria bacterium 
MIKETIAKLEKGEISARELVSGYLDTIKKKDPSLNAYREVFDDAMEEAEKIDLKIKHGDTPRPLEGIPFAIKDNILIKGKMAGAASKILEGYTASYDAACIKKLREAGAIFLGRTNMDEFAMGSSTENSAYGATKNPHDESRVPGGSSGGSAVAVAADMAMAALGSDTGGSIRQPAAFCGVVGLKPTYGAVSRSGLIAMASSLDQIGPIAKTVADAEVVFEAIKGSDLRDATSVQNPKSKSQVPKVIGIPKEYFLKEGMDAEVLKKVEEAIEFLKEKGFEIKEVSLPYTQYALAAYYIVMPAEVSANLARFDGMRYGPRAEEKNLFGVYAKTREKGFGPEVRRRIVLGTYVLSAGYYDAYYGRAQKVRYLIRKDFENEFKNVDVILTPTAPTLPFKIGEKTKDPLSMYLEDIFTVPANLAGVPAMSVPFGEARGLPVGIQLIAPWFEERRLFEVGKVLENVL